MRWTLGLLALGLATLLLAGCTRSLAADDIERELERQLSTQDFVPDVVCDDDLPGEVGATITCGTTLSDGVPVDITVTATEVSGDQVRYEFGISPEGLHDGDIGPAPSNTTSSNTTSSSPAGLAPPVSEVSPLRDVGDEASGRPMARRVGGDLVARQQRPPPAGLDLRRCRRAPDSAGPAAVSGGCGRASGHPCDPVHD